MTDLSALSDQVKSIAQEAGQIAKKYYGNLHESEVATKKNPDDVVTVADEEIETFLKEKLTALDLEADFHGEEFGQENTDKEFTWVVDPIDGTKYFKNDIPIFSISIGLLKNEEPVLGILYQPLLDDFYIAVKDKGVTHNGITIKSLPDLSANRVSVYMDVDDYQDFDSKAKESIDKDLLSLMHTIYRVNLIYNSGIAVAWMVKGLLHGFVDLTGKNPIWDMVAQRVIMTELGMKEVFIERDNGRKLYLACVEPAFEQIRSALETNGTT